jgi:hypothetical protein
MAKITHIQIGMRRLYQHPWISFENFTIEGGLTVELEPGETPARSRREIISDSARADDRDVQAVQTEEAAERALEESR